MKRLILENGLEIIINKNIFDSMIISSWGSENDKDQIGLYHLLEHIILPIDSNLYGFTSYQWMGFTSNENSSLKDIINLFYDNDNNPKIIKDTYFNFISHKFQRDLFCIFNENTIKNNNSQNIITYFLSKQYHFCGNKTTLNINPEEFFQFIKKIWLNINPKNIIFILNNNDIYKIKLIKETFGCLLSKQIEKIDRPKFNYVYGTYELALTNPSIDFIIKNPNLKDLYSFLHLNKNIVIDSLIDDTLILNLTLNNSEILFNNQSKFQELNDIKKYLVLEDDFSHNSSVITFIIFYKKTYSIVNRGYANNFLHVLHNLLKRKQYILSIPCCNHAQIHLEAVNILLTSKNKINILDTYGFYKCVFFCLPLLSYKLNIKTLRNYLFNKKLIYFLYTEYTNTNQNFTIVYTNSLQNEVLYKEIEVFFGCNIKSVFII